MSKTGIIVSGGIVSNDLVLQFIKKEQPAVMIGVDKGITFFCETEITPTHIVGDFDSVDVAIVDDYQSQGIVNVHQFQPEKDASDTEIAVQMAIHMDVDRLWLFGATGTRLDHMMANIQILKLALDAGVKTYIVDAYNKIYLADTKVVIRRDAQFGKYFSLFPFGDTVEGLCVKGAKYPLQNYTLLPDNSRTVSNEIQDEVVEITWQKGVLLVMETRD